jgi:4-amino-4-deoxychorismate lyase
MSASYWVNGRQQDWLSVTDRGLQYGDGLFETMAIHDGRVTLLERHMARLGRGLVALGIDLPPALGIAEEIASRVASTNRGVAKLIVTRGAAGRGYQVAARVPASWILALSDWPAHYADLAKQGVTLRLCRQSLALQPSLAGIKHLNRLEQVLARSEWSEPDIAEGLMRDAAGHLVCGTMSNVFIVRRGQIMTPRLDQCGVRGVMREVIMEYAGGQGIGIKEQTLTLEDALGADELFLSNALFGIWPARQFEHREYPKQSLARKLRSGLARAGVSQCADQ